ncbi:hypothetical protein ACQUW0_25890, partial [Ralstonia pseudosolanacearum]|uniref:hypothetical protein n=1 Tax=Ralstonia pseudosolanacearum TaxID=1310165 RepID=UPI003D181EA6
MRNSLRMSCRTHGKIGLQRSQCHRTGRIDLCGTISDSGFQQVLGEHHRDVHDGEHNVLAIGA